MEEAERWIGPWDALGILTDGGQFVQSKVSRGNQLVRFVENVWQREPVPRGRPVEELGGPRWPSSPGENAQFIVYVRGTHSEADNSTLGALIKLSYTGAALCMLQKISNNYTNSCLSGWFPTS